MALPLPETMSPSKVSSFGNCALAFRLATIDGLPEPPSTAAVRGTLVHLALEHLFDRPAPDRTITAADADLERAFDHLRHDPEFLTLDLDDPARTAFLRDARTLLHRYLDMEDPHSIHPIGLEVMLETNLDGLRLRGIIDRLERDPDGGLIVTDYKTGRSPAPAYAQARMVGLHIYALLCLDNFGVLPAELRLLYLGDGGIITMQPTEQTIRAIRRRVTAVWDAIRRACSTEEFRPRPGPLCNWCSFHEFCPAQGGSLDRIGPALQRLGLDYDDGTTTATVTTAESAEPAAPTEPADLAGPNGPTEPAGPTP